MTPPTAALTVLIVEDEPLWQQGLVQLLATDKRFAVVGIADSYLKGLSAFVAHQPNVVLVDWKLIGEEDGLALAYALMMRGVPSSHIILVSGSDKSLIPDNPFTHVPKAKMAQHLLPALQHLLPISAPIAGPS